MAKRTLPKSVVKKRWIKGLFWTGIFGCLFLSIVAIGRVGVLSAAIEVEPEEMSEVKERPNYAVSEGAQSFAENFAAEYFKWSKDGKEEREKRLEDYLAIGLDTQAGLRYENMKWDSEFLTSQVWKVEETGEQSAAITLRVQHHLSRKVEPSEEEVKKAEKNEEDLPVKTEDGGTHVKFFVVSIKSDGEGFVVNNFPYFIPEPIKPDIEIERNAERNVSSNEQVVENIRGFLETFFTTYTVGSNQELAYYTKGFDLDSLNNLLLFKGVEHVDIYDEGDRFLVHAEVLMEEVTSEAEMVYFYSMELVQEDSRWLMVNFDHQY
jgi:hypothetical protein